MKEWWGKRKQAHSICTLQTTDFEQTVADEYNNCYMCHFAKNEVRVSLKVTLSHGEFALCSALLCSAMSYGVEWDGRLTAAYSRLELQITHAYVRIERTKHSILLIT